MSQLVIVGTGTNVGKTLLSSVLMSAKKDLYYWKPIQSGLLEETDSQIVARLSDCEPSRILPEIYRLQLPLSPHLSARLDGIEIELSNLQLPKKEHLLIETAGGVLVPINDKSLQVDLIATWNLPVVIAASSSLGTINHSLLTIEALRKKNIAIAGIVMIGEENSENGKAIQHYGAAPIIAKIPRIEHINSETLFDVYQKYFSFFEQLL